MAKHELLIVKSDIKRLSEQIDKSVSLLANENFLTKAPLIKVREEEQRLNDFKRRLDQTIITVEEELDRYVQSPFVHYFIQEIRAAESTHELFSEEWFDEYSAPVQTYEKEKLLKIYKSGQLLHIFMKNIENVDPIEQEEGSL